MAFSLTGERPIAAVAPANPLAVLLRWISRAQAARARRVALSALLELDRDGLDDLGISRGDVISAMAAPNQAGRLLHAARAIRARG